MLFQSNEFLFLFLPVCLAAFFLARCISHTLSLATLVVLSLFFYGWHEPVYVALIVGSVVFNFVLGVQISATRRRSLVATGVAVNLFFLGMFKYTDFIFDNLNALGAAAIPHLGLVLPLAISFFTFQQIAFLVDCYKTQARPARFLNYSLFVVFFPQLIAGPIVHHREMMPQFEKRLPEASSWRRNIAIGATIFVVGLFKKLGVADTLGQYADYIFDGTAASRQLDLIAAWLGASAFGFQIYFDFSGYADMAVGLARLFGIILPINFNSPYRSTSIIEFWRRWHITLSRFLRDYLYIPLGGSRQSAGMTLRNIMIVMLLGGLWHGAAWTFVLWGGLHGLYICAAHLWRWQIGKRAAVEAPDLFGQLFWWALTMAAVTFAWVPFRAPSLAATFEMWRAMVGINGVALPAFSSLEPVRALLNRFGIGLYEGGLKSLIATIGPVSLLWFLAAAIIAFVMPNTYQMMRRFRPVLVRDAGVLPTPRSGPAWRPTLLWTTATIALAVFSYLLQGKPVEFLYFQF